MASFKIANDGSIITVSKYKCKNTICQEINNFRRVITSLTPNGSVKVNVNSAKYSLQTLNEYKEADYYEEYDKQGNILYKECEMDVTEEYTWDFVECRHCRRFHLLQTNYNSSNPPVEEGDNENLYPLFYVAVD